MASWRHNLLICERIASSWREAPLLAMTLPYINPKMICNGALPARDVIIDR